MNVYKVSCYSSCGSYFASYLKSVTVIASSQADAIQRTQAWLDNEGRQFIRNDPKTWDVDEVHNCTDDGVIDWHEDSDY